MEKPFKCSFCDHRAREKSAVIKHVRSIHTLEAPYKCKYCDQTFKVQSNLARHVRAHTGWSYATLSIKFLSKSSHCFVTMSSSENLRKIYPSFFKKLLFIQKKKQGQRMIVLKGLIYCNIVELGYN